MFRNQISLIILQAVSQFQKFAGLEVTGQLDKETVDMMLKPRHNPKSPPTPDMNSMKVIFLVVSYSIVED